MRDDRVGSTSRPALRGWRSAPEGARRCRVPAEEGKAVGVNDPERRERRAARRVVKAVESEPAVGDFEENMRELAIELLGGRLEALAVRPRRQRSGEAPWGVWRALQERGGAVVPPLFRWAEGLVREAG